jgi:hypothetical protein
MHEPRHRASLWACKALYRAAWLFSPWHSSTAIQCRSSSTAVSQQCRSGATAVPQQCRSSATAVPQQCRSSATAVPQQCRSSATAVPQAEPNGKATSQQDTGLLGGAYRDTILTLLRWYTGREQQLSNRVQGANTQLGASGSCNCLTSTSHFQFVAAITTEPATKLAICITRFCISRQNDLVQSPGEGGGPATTNRQF